MILKTYLNGVQVDNSNRVLTAISDTASASIDLADYKRGGRAGVALSVPYYRNFVMSMTWRIVGSSSSDLITQKDAFLKLWNLSPVKTGIQTKLLGFEMADGTIKQVPIIVSTIKSSISPENLRHADITIVVRTELEYFVRSTSSTKNIPIYQGGGMPVPMAVPMDMSSPLGGQTVIIENLGNAEYFPTITANGSFVGFSLKNATTGLQLDYSGTLGASDTLIIDMYNRTALFNGLTNALADISGEWWSLSPGENDILLITSSGDGDADVVHADAFRGL